VSYCDEPIPDGETFRNATIVRAFEPPEEVVIPYSLAYAKGLQPEDYGVLIRLLLRDPDQPSSVLALSEEFQASGWKMGEKRLREVMKRLKKAGHVEHKREYNPVTRRPEWQFRVYRNPANNQAYVNRGAHEASQVSPIGRNSADQTCGGASDPAEIGVCAGQADRAEFGGSAPTRRNSADRSDDVSAGQGRYAENGRIGSPPPHPPEGGERISPPHPLTSGQQEQTPNGQGEGETIRFAQEDIAAAEDVLLSLIDPWAIGTLQARKLAPQLLTVMVQQGWPGIHVVNRQLLAFQMTKNPPRVVKSAARLLEKDRIPNLPRYEAVAHSGVQQAAERDQAAPEAPQEPQRATEIAAALSEVVEAYVAASSRHGFIVSRETKQQLREDAAVLLADTGCSAQWLASRAAEMAANRWTDLAKHVSRSRKPVDNGQQVPKPDPTCRKCNGTGKAEDPVTGRPTGEQCGCITAAARV
jgi:hypothetical protein